MGLGIGLICGAVLLQLMSFGMNASLELPEEDDRSAGEMTEEQWLALADRFGYVAVKAGERRYTQEELDAAVAAAREEGRRTAADAPEPEPTESYAILIRRGMNAQDVGEMLFVLGLIESVDEFNDYMKSRGLTSRIRAGRYRFDGKPTLEEIASRITVKE
jgi:hypothetical protein